MTLSTQTSKAAYTGNGTSTAFPLPFPFLRAADIKALLLQEGVETALVLGTHYTLAGAGDPAGGTLSMNMPPATGQTLVVWRAPAIVQETDYVENAAFPAETHEAALDLLTMICQSLQEQIDRAVLYPVSTPASDMLDSADFLDACEGARDQALAALAEGQTLQDAVQESIRQVQEAVQGVRASQTDAAPGSLSAKLHVGDGLAEALLNPGADETLRLSLALAQNPGLELAAGLLRVRAASGSGLGLSATGLSVDTGTAAGAMTNTQMLRQAVVASRVFTHSTFGGA